MAAIIRLARESDAERMLAIYAPVVRDTAISFELEPPTEDDFRGRIRSTLQHTPWLACGDDEDILGYAYAGRFRPRAAYQWSVEVSVYVAPDRQGRGVGRALYTSLFECLRLQGYHNAYAGIALPNPASIALHERFGFEAIGAYRSVGYKHGRWHDVGWWQLTIQELGSPPAPPARLDDALGSPGWQEALGKGEALLGG